MQVGQGEVHVVMYENLVVDPITELGRTLEFLEWNEVPVEDLPVRRPSGQASMNLSTAMGADFSSSWTHRISSEDLDHAKRLLARFNLDKIYSESAIPQVPNPIGLLRPPQ